MLKKDREAKLARIQKAVRHEKWKERQRRTVTRSRGWWGTA